MRRSVSLLLAAALLVPAIARAQTAAPPPLDAFLEQRVPEELARDGILLSRLGVTLAIDVVGERLLVTLVDNATGRVDASTTLDQVPADREAAVASVTELVSTLAQQLTQPIAPPPPPPRPPAPQDDDDPLHPRDAAAAEYAYAQQAIGFGDQLDVTQVGNNVTVGHHWTAHRGEVQEPLPGVAFYQAIGRPDLVAQYHHREHVMDGFIVVAGVGLVATIGSAIELGSVAGQRSACAPLSTRASCEADVDARMHDWEWAVGGAAVVTTVGALFAALQHRHLDPVSEAEAKRLAAEHNRALRKSLGLPTLSSFAPYVAPDGGGLAVAGRF